MGTLTLRFLCLEHGFYLPRSLHLVQWCDRRLSAWLIVFCLVDDRAELINRSGNVCEAANTKDNLEEAETKKIVCIRE
jgi:hypothetical protein